MDRAFKLYLGVLALIGCAVIYLATSRMGPGVSTDSAQILATAENVALGKGLIDYRGVELTQFPPLYSLIMATGSLILRQDVFVIGWGLNVLVFGALIWFCGVYFFDAFREEPILAYFGSFVVLSSASLIQITANIASDPLFMLIVILFLMSTTAYLKTERMRYLLLAAALVVVGCFQRYAGLALAISGAFIVAYKYRRTPGNAVLWGGLFGILTAAPIVLWGFLHNYAINGTVFGARLPSVADLNFVAGAQKILYWFIPYRIISAMGVLPLLGIVIFLLVLAIIMSGARQFIRQLGSPELVPNIAFLVVYLSVLVFNISYYELKGLKTDRVHIIVLPSLLMILLAAGSQILGAAKQKVGKPLAYAAVIGLFVVWSSFPISRSNEYVRSAMARGDTSSYNSINKGDVLNSPLADYLRTLDFQNRKVYSNGADTTWFIMRTQVNPLPVLSSQDRGAELQERYPSWPGPGESGYLVWINAEAYKTDLATPAELGTVASVNLLYSDDSADVYLVVAR